MQLKRPAFEAFIDTKVRIDSRGRQSPAAGGLRMTFGCLWMKSQASHEMSEGIKDEDIGVLSHRQGLRTS